VILLVLTGVRRFPAYLFPIWRAHIDSGACTLCEVIKVALLSFLFHIVGLASHHKLVHIHHFNDSCVFAKGISIDDGIGKI
jgi:hypothetical protein